MNREDIIRTANKIANQCTRRTPSTWTHEFAVSYIMSMVELAIEEENEACAGLRKEVALQGKHTTEYEEGFWDGLEKYEDLIRARGQA